VARTGHEQHGEAGGIVLEQHLLLRLQQQPARLEAERGDRIGWGNGGKRRPRDQDHTQPRLAQGRRGGLGRPRVLVRQPDLRDAELALSRTSTATSPEHGAGPLEVHLAVGVRAPVWGWHATKVGLGRAAH
jgi:hypothetical protein